MLPSSQQLQAAAINQLSLAQDGPSAQAVGTPCTAGLTVMPSQILRSQETTANTSVTTAHQSFEIMTSSWLYGDITATPMNTLLTDPTSSLVSIGAGLLPLSNKLIRQIKAGEFVNFCDLLLAKTQSLTSLDTSQMSVLALLQLQEAGSQKKLVPDFLTWTQCFFCRELDIHN